MTVLFGSVLALAMVIGCTSSTRRGPIRNERARPICCVPVEQAVAVRLSASGNLKHVICQLFVSAVNSRNYAITKSGNIRVRAGMSNYPVQ